MKSTALALSMILGLSLTANANPSMSKPTLTSRPSTSVPFSCSIERDKAIVAEIGDSDLVSSASGHQFSYKKTVAGVKTANGLEIEVYRDTRGLGKGTTYILSMTDREKVVQFSSASEFLTYKTDGVEFQVGCSDEIFK